MAWLTILTIDVASAAVPFDLRFPIAAEPEEMSTGQQLLLVVGILMVVVFVLRLGVRRRGLGRSGEPSPRAAIEKFGPLRSATAAPAQELDGILVRLQETGREIEARLDTKIRYAQRLLQEAEEALARLDVARARATDAAERIAKGETPRSSPAPAMTATPTSASPVSKSPTPAPAPSGLAGPRESISRGEPRATAKPSEPRAEKPQPGPRAKTPPSARTRPEEQSQERIRALAAEGRDATAIAREVGRPIGEVQLILALGRESAPDDST